MPDTVLKAHVCIFGLSLAPAREISDRTVADLQPLWLDDQAAGQDRGCGLLLSGVLPLSPDRSLSESQLSPL